MKAGTAAASLAREVTADRVALEDDVLIYREPAETTLETVATMMARARELTRGVDRWFMLVDLSEVHRHPPPRVLASIIKNVRGLEARYIALFDDGASAARTAAVRFVLRIVGSRSGYFSSASEARAAFEARRRS
ncbi:MAG: hypothetical protein KC503_04680 [Myxococcales bacterium]|nr:hypothetical protein [Myxococcales bacterium]